MPSREGAPRSITQVTPALTPALDESWLYFLLSSYNVCFPFIASRRVLPNTTLTSGPCDATCHILYHPTACVCVTVTVRVRACVCERERAFCDVCGVMHVMRVMCVMCVVVP